MHSHGNPYWTAELYGRAVLGLREDGPGQVMVSLQAGGTRLLARITQHSAKALQLQAGMPVYAQIKGMALLD